MLAWLKRKGPPGPGEAPLDGAEPKPAADDRLGRMLGRLDSDGRVADTGAAPRLQVSVELPSSPAGSAPEAVAEMVKAADSPGGDTAADEYLALRRGDDATAEGGPSDLELFARGYSFATVPDDTMAVGEPTDTVPSPLNAAAEPIWQGFSSLAAWREFAPPEPAVAETAEPERQEFAPPELAVAETTKPVAAAPKAVTRRARSHKRPVRHSVPKAVDKSRVPPSTDRKPPVERAAGFGDMCVIAVASQKGGSGKTTIAAHLAVRAAQAGNGPVVLIDTDSQGSLAEWWEARSEETPALARVRPEALGANLAELRGYGTAMAIIDTPPALTGSIEQVIATADLILIPVRPSPHDLRAAGGTVEMARAAGKPFMFVVNAAAPRASITAQAVAALSEHGRVAPVILYQRTEYAASMIDGRTVVETAPSGRSAREIAELWRCVYAQIGLRVAA